MTLTSTQLAEAWAASLESCVALNNYCHENFGKPPTIFLGLDVRDMPGAKDAPYVALVPFGVKGGAEADRTEISVHVAVGAEYKTKPTTTGRIVRSLAGERMEEELWPLVRQALEDSGSDFVPQEFEFEMGAAAAGFMELRAALIVTEDTTL